MSSSLIPFPCPYGFKTMEEDWKKKKEGYVTSNPLDVFTMWKTFSKRVKEIDFATSWKTFFNPVTIFFPSPPSPLFFTDRYYARRTLPFLGLQLEFISRGMQSFLDFFTVEGFAETTLPHRKSLIFLVSADEGKRREVLCRGFVSSSSFGVFSFFFFFIVLWIFYRPRHLVKKTASNT